GVPVLLLHGAQDKVIPPSELAWADRELRGRDHRALVSPLLDHVQVGPAASWRDYVELTAFMANLFY
ncbi:MAG: S9 family peptidase, partial [Polyangiaceae bacterium]|nr:S9 family peptidase [Polyangiaceae bacterium]